MAGNQYGFIYSFHKAIINLYSVVSSRIQHYMAMYNLTNDQIYYINLIFYQQDRKLLSEFALTKPSHISNCENSLTAVILTVPIPVNEDSIGKPLGVIFVYITLLWYIHPNILKMIVRFLLYLLPLT